MLQPSILLSRLLTLPAGAVGIVRNHLFSFTKSAVVNPIWVLPVFSRTVVAAYPVAGRTGRRAALRFQPSIPGVLHTSGVSASYMLFSSSVSQSHPLIYNCGFIDSRLGPVPYKGNVRFLLLHLCYFTDTQVLSSGIEYWVRAICRSVPLFATVAITTRAARP